MLPGALRILGDGVTDLGLDPVVPFVTLVPDDDLSAVRLFGDGLAGRRLAGAADTGVT